MRTPHYWRRPRSSSCPVDILVVDTETVPRKSEDDPNIEIHTFRLGVARYFRLERGQETRVRVKHFDSTSTFLAFLESCLRPKRVLTIVGHNIAYDLAAMGLFVHMQLPPWSWRKYILDKGKTYLKGYYFDKRVDIIDLFNYLPMSLERIGRDMGLEKLPMPDWDAPDTDWYVYCERDVLVTARAITQIIQYIRTNDYGPWAPTISSLAFNTYRKRFMRHKVLVHCNKKALELEREAYHGGAVDCAYIGRVEASPIYECDVNSMYPYVCTFDLPTRLVAYYRSYDVSRLKDIMSRKMCIARVRLESNDYQYPAYEDKRLCYCRGRFDAVLAHPELGVALKRNHVKKIYDIAIYDRAPIFREYMQTIWRAKQEYDAAGMTAFRAFAKMLLNSLYGKTGQLSPQWQPWSEQAWMLVEQHHHLPAGTLRFLYQSHPPNIDGDTDYIIPDYGLVIALRLILGHVQLAVGHAESRDSCPAIAACVTSYARRYLRHIQSIAGPRNWYYSDTDSIWVDHAGLDRLEHAGLVRHGVMGGLEIKGKHEQMIIYGPKDYVTDRTRKLKGIRPHAEQVGPATYRQLHFPSALSLARLTHDHGIICRYVVKSMRREIRTVAVCESGWTHPYILTRW